MIRRILPAVFAVSMIALSGGAWSAPAASAAVACDNIINDGANVFNDKDEDRVEEAAQSLESAVGADVRVFTATSYGNTGTLDKLIEDTQKQCSSWQSPNGGRKSNLIVFATTMKERKLGIFYGESWVNVFRGGGEIRIWRDVMTPQFKTGDFVQGFVDGITETEQVISDDRRPDNGGNMPSASNGDSGGNGGMIFLVVLLVIIFVVAIGSLVVWMTSRRTEKREREERRAASRTEALRLRDASSNILGAINDSSRRAVREAKVKKYSVVSPKLAADLGSLLRQVNENYADATTAKQDAASAKPDDDDLSELQYNVMQKRYQLALDLALAAKEANDKIDQIVAEVDQQLANVNDSINAANSRLETLNSSISELAAQGVTCDSIQERVATASKTLEEATSRRADISVLADLGTVDSTLSEAEESLAELQKQMSDLRVGLPKLRERIDVVKAMIPETKECFGQISGEYAESSWESVVGNVTEAENRVAAAEASLSQASSLSSMDKQQWEEATSFMQQGNELLDDAISLQQSIAKLGENLTIAKETAQQEIDDAQSDIDKAESYLQQYGNDISDDRDRDLEQAKFGLEQAKRELAKSKPDYLIVVNQALTANHSADSILEDSISEREAAERLRRQATSALQSASHQVSIAREYIEDHRSDVKRGAKDKLRAAEVSLSQAQGATDPKQVLSAAQAAAQMAEQAYSKARRNHKDAEDERDAERRRRSYNSGSGDFATGVVIGSVLNGGHSSSWGSSSSYGGGSSGSFGGSDFGGGSSGGFGGGGDGGGSSGGW